MSLNFFGQELAELSRNSFCFRKSERINYILQSKGWITQNENINTLYKRTSSNNLTLRSTIGTF